MAWKISLAVKSENVGECLGKVLDVFVRLPLSPGHPCILEAGYCDGWPLSLNQYGHSPVLTYLGNILFITVIYLRSLHFLDVYTVVQTFQRRD